VTSKQNDSAGGGGKPAAEVSADRITVVPSGWRRATAMSVPVSPLALMRRVEPAVAATE
jgi:hypothetical protein